MLKSSLSGRALLSRLKRGVRRLESMYSLYNGDCIKYLKALQDESVELAFIDIPYGLGVAEWDKEISGLESFELARKKLVNGGSIYATCTAHILDEIKSVMNWRRIITWCKPNLPLRKNMQDYEWSTEFILWETKGEARIFNKPHGESARDYWRIPVENGFLNTDKNHHPARKPVALLKRIILTSSCIGDTILDPFMGSGTTGVACVETGRNFIGCEIDKQHFQTAEKRIQQASLQGSLFKPANKSLQRSKGGAGGSGNAQFSFAPLAR